MGISGLGGAETVYGDCNCKTSERAEAPSAATAEAQPKIELEQRQTAATATASRLHVPKHRVVATGVTDIVAGDHMNVTSPEMC